MQSTGEGTHYREVLLRMRAQRITCTRCGFIRECRPAQGDDYELWYRARLGDQTVWATNRAHLDVLVGWLTGALDTSRLDLADDARIQALPSWLKERRVEAAAALLALPHD